MSNEPTSRDIRDLTRAINDNTKAIKDRSRGRQVGPTITNYGGEYVVNQMIADINTIEPRGDDFSRVERLAQELVQKGWGKRA